MQHPDNVNLEGETVLALLSRLEQAERQSTQATSALKALAERNIELTEQKRVLNIRFDAMRASRDSERSRADKNAHKLDQAEQAVARVREVGEHFWPKALHQSVPLGVADSQSQIITGELLRALDGDGRG